MNNCRGVYKVICVSHSCKLVEHRRTTVHGYKKGDIGVLDKQGVCNIIVILQNHRVAFLCVAHGQCQFVGVFHVVGYYRVFSVYNERGCKYAGVGVVFFLAAFGVPRVKIYAVVGNVAYIAVAPVVARCEYDGYDCNECCKYSISHYLSEFFGYVIFIAFL